MGGVDTWSASLQCAMKAIEVGKSLPQTLVLLHGMGTGASGWQPQLDALADRFHVLAPFLPGYGQEPGPFTLEGASDVVVELLNDRNASPVYVCGLSLGALVALELARVHPRLVSRLVLSAGFVSIPEEHRAPRVASAEAVRGFDPVAFSQQVLPGLVNDVPEPHKEQALTEISGLTPAAVANLIEMDFDASSWIGELNMPTLVLCGDQDEVNLPLSRRLAESLPNARFELVPDAGHVANLDAPSAFTDALLEFLVQ